MMNSEFTDWLSKQRYRYYRGDPVNDNTEQDWIIDGVMKPTSLNISSSVINWDDLTEFSKPL